MLSKPQLLFFFKKSISSSVFQKAFCPSLNLFPRQPLQFLHRNFFSFQSAPVKNKYTDDLALLQGFSKNQLAYADEIINRYSSSHDLKTFNPGEIQWIVSLLQHFANGHKYQGSLQRAYSYIKEAEQIFEKTNIDNSFLVANNHAMKTSLCLDLNDTETDIEYHFDEVDRICELLGDDPEARSLRIHNLFTQGDFQKRRNKQDKALKLFRQVIKNKQDIIDAAVPTLLIPTYEEIGKIYASRGEVDKAVKYWTNGLELAIPHSGENSSQAFFFNSEMAELLYQNQRYQEALPLINKALQVALEIYPQDGEEIGWCHCLLGHILFANNSAAKALEEYKKAIKIYEMQPEQDFQNISDAYFYAAKASHQLKDSQETNILSRKSIELLFKSEDPEMIEICLQRAEQLAPEERFEEIGFHFEEALKACKKLTPNDKEKLAETNFLLGEFTFFVKEDYENAFELLKESERLQQESSAPSPPLFLLHTYLAGLNALSKDYNKCVKYLQSTAEACQAIGYFGYLQQVYYYLAKVYNKIGMTKEAKETEEKLENLCKKHNQEDPLIKGGVQLAQSNFSVFEKLDG